MKTTRTVRCLACLLVILPLGCGGGGGGENGGPGPGGGGINSGDASFDRRYAVSKAVSDLYDTLPHTDVQDENRKILELLKGRPELEAAGQGEPGSVWARFKDNGEVFVVINSGAVSKVELTRGRSAAVNRPPMTGRAATEIPSGQKIFLMNDMGADARYYLADVTVNARNAYLWLKASAHMLTLQQLFQDSAGPNYTQTISSSGTPATLKTVKDADALYMYGHAGWGVDRAGRRIFVLNTAEPTIEHFLPAPFNGNLQTYKSLLPDIQAGRVGMSMIVDGIAGDLAPPNRKLTIKPYYYVTPEFVRHYMTFKPNTSFVFINGCNAADPVYAGDLMAAFKEKNAAVYASWENHTNGLEVMDTADLLFSGLCGGKLWKFPIVPPQRPFSYTQLVAGMMNQPRDGQSYSYAQTNGEFGLISLKIAEALSGGAKFGRFAPAIRAMNVYTMTRDRSELRITGNFGERQGKVTVNGNALNVTEWSNTLIKADLPRHDQPGGHGDVVVEVDGHKSNPAQLSLYTFNFRQEDTHEYNRRFLLIDNPEENRKVYGDPIGSYTTNVNLTVWARVHVQDIRTEPYQKPPFSSPLRDFVLTSSDIGTRNARVESWSVSGAVVLALSSEINGNFETQTSTYSADGIGPVALDGSNPKGNVGSIHGSMNLIKKELFFYTNAWVNPAVKIDIRSDQQSGGRIQLGTTDLRVTRSFTMKLNDAGEVLPGSESWEAKDDTRGATHKYKLSWSANVSSKPKTNNPRSARAIRQ